MAEDQGTGPADKASDLDIPEKYGKEQLVLLGTALFQLLLQVHGQLFAQAAFIGVNIPYVLGQLVELSAAVRLVPGAGPAVGQMECQAETGPGATVTPDWNSICRKTCSRI
mgnify:CR=1 FL=1